MILHCKNCKNKFSIIKEESNLVGKIVQCRHCNEEWIYESKSKYLENRLAELGEDLNKTEIKLNIKKDEHKEKIINLENNLKIKNEELNNQKKLEEQVLAFEKRLTDTEKTNSEQIDLEIKIVDIEKKIKSMHEDIYTKNKDIEQKTNYIETKISSYNHEGNINSQDDERKIKVNSREVVDLRVFDNDNKRNKDQETDNKKRKKFRFFTPDYS
jgi:predicted Zn finger-like uncharacterized protein